MKFILAGYLYNSTGRDIGRSGLIWDCLQIGMRLISLKYRCMTLFRLPEVCRSPNNRFAL